jgi:hypothetical protein
MRPIVSVKFNPEEAALLARAHAASGTPGLSSHIKQVYFSAVRPDAHGLQDIRSELQRIDATLREVCRRDEHAGDADLLLSLCCSLYLMVRRSVSDSIRAQADQSIDVSAVEAFLKDR